MPPCIRTVSLKETLVCRPVKGRALFGRRGEWSDSGSGVSFPSSSEEESAVNSMMREPDEDRLARRTGGVDVGERVAATGVSAGGD